MARKIMTRTESNIKKKEEKKGKQTNIINCLRSKMSKRVNSGWHWTKKEAKHLIFYLNFFRPKMAPRQKTVG